MYLFDFEASINTKLGKYRLLLLNCILNSVMRVIYSDSRYRRMQYQTQLCPHMLQRRRLLPVLL